jgi:quercetin dioxygenase-like cupin family protein
MSKREQGFDTGHASKRSLDGTSLRFDLAAETAALSAVESAQVEGHNAKTLIKHSDFTVVLVALKAGASLPEHQTEQRVSIHTLSGRVRLRLPSETVELPAQHLLTLDHAVPHDVEAIEDSAILLTVVRAR